jgi:hypothetical protein
VSRESESKAGSFVTGLEVERETPGRPVTEKPTWQMPFRRYA